MPETRQRRRLLTSKEAEKPEPNDVVCISDGDEEENSPPGIEVHREKLRKRWELASVLNFFNVFEPVIQSHLKISAEEIENALIEPNDALAQLHVVLLKEVAPSSKKLKVSDAWVSVLAKKLETWWPWVAEGEFPLTAAKGEEMSRYKELDPAIRLRILKALCELRADQDDIVTYINDTKKNGTGLCTFQKEKIGEDGRGTLYWCDGNEDIGYRLYKEVQVFQLKPKLKGEADRLGIISVWETLATNLEEFHKAVCKFSSSKVQLEVKVAKAVVADVLPTLERLQKKKERVLKKQERQEKLAALRNSAVIRVSRNRTRRPISYRFEEYDKAIKEAIEVTQYKNISGRRKGGECKDSESTESDSSSEDHPGVTEDNNANDGPEDVSSDCQNHLKDRNEEENNICYTKSWAVRRTGASRCNEGPAGNVDMKVDEAGTSLTTKQKLRQRPTINTSVKSSMISDAEDENTSKDVNKRIRLSGNSSEPASIDEDDFSW